MLPNVRKRTRGPLIYLRTSTLVARCFKEFFFIFFLLQFIFGSQTFQPTVFNQALKSKLKFTFLSQLQNQLHEENPSLSSILEPLYCSSYATTVGGIRFINFVDSGTPTVARIKWRRCRGWCLSANDDLMNTCDPHHKSW